LVRGGDGPDVPQFLQLGCALRQTGFVFQWVSSLAMAAAFVAVIALLYGARALSTHMASDSSSAAPEPAKVAADDEPLKRVESLESLDIRRAKLRRRGVRLLAAVPALLYMRLSTLAMQAFLCVDNTAAGSSVKVLALDAVVTCGSPQHAGVLAGSVLLFIVLTIGFPVTIVTLLVRREKMLSKDVRDACFRGFPQSPCTECADGKFTGRAWCSDWACITSTAATGSWCCCR
jgi:hypothetical protein